jgi:hypothetical protein
MKRLSIVMLIMAFAVGFVLTGCNEANPEPEGPPADVEVDLSAASDWSASGPTSADYDDVAGTLTLTFDTTDYAGWARNFYDTARDLSDYNAVVVDADIQTASCNYKVGIACNDYTQDYDQWGPGSVGRADLTLDLSSAASTDLENVYQLVIQNNDGDNLVLVIYSITFTFIE